MNKSLSSQQVTKAQQVTLQIEVEKCTNALIIYLFNHFIDTYLASSTWKTLP